MTAWDRTWPAPAKLNLFLHVVGRRPDGYHLLQTVFRFIDFADTLHFTPRDDGRIVLATPIPGVPPEQDLVVRAAAALRKVDADKTAGGVTIRLEKRLPMGGGLGGGSSDAATTLIALNHLWGCGLPRTALQSIGLTLGADVPIFIHGRNAFAEGIGEHFSDVSLPKEWYLLTVPDVAVPTAAVFGSSQLRRNTPAIVAADWAPGFGHNDLEPVAADLYPEVASHLALLRAMGNARMTGSGACCFTPFEEETAARRAMSALPAGVVAHIVRGLDEHPLRALT